MPEVNVQENSILEKLFPYYKARTVQTKGELGPLHPKQGL